MSISVATLVFAVSGVACVVAATYVYIQARANVGLNAEREELAKAHKIVMDMALMYQMPSTDAKYKRLEELRADIQGYYELATKPKLDRGDQVGNVIYAFEPSKYKARSSE